MEASQVLEKAHNHISPVVVVIGIGQLGQTFSSGLLRTGHQVIPVTRRDSPAAIAECFPFPKAVVVAVAEDGIENMLQTLPAVWRDRLILLQNELLPSTWRKHGIDSPTVFVCWYEKKQHSALLDPSGAPSQVYGKHAQLVAEAHQELGIGCHVLSSEVELLHALVAKAVLILVINICGLVLPYTSPHVGGTFEQLLCSHAQLFQDVARESLLIQVALCEIVATSAEKALILNRVLRMMRSIPEHRNCGRVARQRLERALSHAQRLGLDAPALLSVHARALSTSGPPEVTSKEKACEQVWNSLAAVARLDDKNGSDFSQYVPDFEGSEKCIERVQGWLPFPTGVHPNVFLTSDASLRSLSNELARKGVHFLMASGGLQLGVLDSMTWEGMPVGSLKSIAADGPLDVVVTGVTAVSRTGYRLGEGHEYFDIEWGFLCALGLATCETDVIALAHDCQVVSGTWDIDGHDATVDIIVTPTQVVRTGAKKTVGQLRWEAISETLMATPFFAELRSTL